MKPTYSPKFVSTIAALSLCVSSAVAHHPDTKWEIKGSNGASSQSNHSGSGSGSSDTTTISNLESGKKITTKSDANGTISSLVIQQETNNNNNPTLEVGNGSNNSIVNVPTITIEAGATLNRTIQNGQGNNRWNILFRGGSTIESFENKGTIKSNSTADTVYLFTDGDGKGGQTVVKNFTNNGTIESTDNGAAIRLHKGAKIETFKNESGKLISATGNAVAIKVEEGSNILGTFINEGTIKAAGQGINLTNATITNFTNKGLIKAEGRNNGGQHKENHPVYLKESTIDTFINEGIIENASTYGGSLNDGTVHAAIYLEGTHNSKNTIKSFDNKGTIKAKRAGIFIFGSKTTITHLKNSGTIEINNNNSNGNNVNNNNVSAGIMFGYLVGNNPTYETIQNEGIIKGGDYGIFIEGGTITHLKNSGTIEGNKDGIAFYNAGGTLQTTINNLEIDGGIIRGGVNGINISKTNTNSDQTIIGSLTIKQNATVEGTNGSGLVLGKDSSNSDKYQLTGKIQVDGTLKGTKAGITNYGQLGSDNNGSQEVIVVGENGRIDGVVKNAAGGTLQGNITNKSSNVLEIDNQGKTGDKTVINSEGSGGVKIKDWKLENKSSGQEVKVIEFKGNNGNITLEKLTISAENTDVTKVAQALQGDKKANALASTKVVSTQGEITFDGDLLRGLVANIDGSKTAAAALNRTLIATATARATLLDSVMGNALNTLSFLHHRASSSLGSYKNANLYANATTIRNDLLSQSSSYASNKNNLFFVLPYYSYTKVELDKGVFSKGHTQGLVLGYSFFNPKS
ncbi:hypothetical protein, partial [Helicobacter sp. 10-6591]|uniref:hypothetical protein n=1 Tax=Helicobacter sp. 10-6591 TaxID=2004998 RepID=UPI000DCC6511